MAAKPSDKESTMRWAAAGVGLEMAAGVAGLALLGYAFDHWRQTRPWGMLIGALLGILAGLIALIRLALKMNRH